MAKYHLQKQTRRYDGVAYSGHSIQFLRAHLANYSGIAAESANLEEAIRMREVLQRYNPIGWNIWNSESGMLVDGLDMFASSNETIQEPVDEEEHDDGAYAHDDVGD